MQFFFFCTQFVTTDSDVFDQQPRIISQNGHIIFQTAANHNITFRAVGAGSIRINDNDLAVVVEAAKRSNEDLDKLKSVDLASMQQTLTRLADQINEIQLLGDRMDHAERVLSNLMATVQNLTSARTNVNNRINRNRNRITLLETRMQTLQTTLTRNECASNPCRNGGTCEDSYNRYLCRCPSNWGGPTCEEDVNECGRFAGTPQGCQNGATCFNTPGSWSCQCPPDWHGLLCTEKHDDCSSSSSLAMCGHGTCINQARVQAGQLKYTCICEPGWTSSGSDPTCSVDVDECSWPRYPCSASPRVDCYNTPGSYICTGCPSGFTGNGYVCADVDECLQNNGGCSMYPMVQCHNTLGSRLCGACPQGYQGNGITCTQVNVCTQNNGGCHHLAVCINNPGFTGTGRECRCPPGYLGSGDGPHGCVLQQGGTAVTAVVPSQNACQNRPCLHGTCVVAGVSYHCLCQLGYTGLHCESETNECISNPCLNGGTCTDQLNGFSCSCPDYFTGMRCEVPPEDCGGFLTQEVGRLRYPASPGTQYSHGRNCAWVITTTWGKVLNLTFNEFHLEGSHDCQFDFLLIKDGGDDTAPTIGRYCGTDMPNTTGIIVTTHNQVYLYFRSDVSVAGDGFNLRWNTTDPVCGAQLFNAEYGVFNSPGYPGKYPHLRDCYWTIGVNFGKKIRFQFATLQLETHENCSFDFLEIRDGELETSPPLAKYCSSTTPPPLVTSGSYAFIHFHSDDSLNDNGFHITYSSVPGVPGCGGVFTASSGALTTPDFPNVHDHNLECDWLIRVAQGEHVKLTFTHLDIERSSPCRWDYVEVRDGSDGRSPVVGSYCGNVLPPPHISTTHQLFIRFRSDSSIAGSGFRAEYTTLCGGVFTGDSGSIKSPYHPNRYPGSRECVYIISQPLGKSVVLEFQAFDVEESFSGSCDFDYLEVRDGDSEASPLLSHLCGNRLPNPIISTHNYLWLKFKTDDSVHNYGFLATYRTEDVACGGIITNTSQHTITSPNHPVEYPHGVTCRWIIKAPPGYVVQLTFSSFIVEQTSGCSFDYVEIFDNTTVNGTGGSMGGRYCGSTKPPVKTTTDNVMTVVFVADDSIAHEGFSASFTLIDASRMCEFTYYTELGIIRSPNYPLEYPHDRDCTWKIQVPSGRQIELNFTDFEVERSTGCVYDYLEILNGGHETSPSLGRFCGTDISQIVRSHTNQIFLKFHTDSSVGRRGFSVFWSGTSTGCGGEVHSTSGSIVSPNYPSHYGHSATCEWLIMVNQGSLVTMQIVDLDLEESAGCYDRVEIRDGNNARARELVRYCTNTIPSPVTSTSNQAFVRFTTDYSRGGRGFRLIYNTACNNEIGKGWRGVIESPNFPNAYPLSRNCTWRITAPRGNRLQLTFSHMQLESAENCQYDYVELSLIHI